MRKGSVIPNHMMNEKTEQYIVLRKLIHLKRVLLYEIMYRYYILSSIPKLIH